MTDQFRASEPDHFTGDPGLPEPEHVRNDAAAVDAATADGSIHDDGAASLADTAVVDVEAQPRVDRNPSRGTAPGGDDVDVPPREAQQDERRREVRGNRGPDELKSYGQGA